MITNQEYQRDLRWITKQIYLADKRGDLCSPVTNADAPVTYFHSYILRVRRNNLYLEGRSKTYLRASLNQVSDVTWQRGGSFIKLSFEVDARKYCVQIYAPAIVETIRNDFPQNWLEMIVRLLFRRPHFASQMRVMVQANFAEAEKWRAVFPDAEFPDTKIPHAKS